MPYVVGIVLLGIAAYFVFRRRRGQGSGARVERCPKCGGPLAFRERNFRGAAKEYYYECRNPACSYRRPA
jgi:hypothetical protein